jgi:hypothetical protein
MSLWLASFFIWCVTAAHLTDIPDLFLDTLLRCHEAFTGDISPWNEDIAVLNSLFEAHLAPLMKDVCEWGYDVFPTIKCWDMFLLAASIMLQNIRAERNGIWSMHLSSVRSMLPFCCVTNRNNYSRWTSIYLLDMPNLPSEVESRFKAGIIAIRQKVGSFNGVWSGMATEKAIIKHSKRNGGIVGLTRKKYALIRWNIT